MNTRSRSMIALLCAPLIASTLLAQVEPDFEDLGFDGLGVRETVVASRTSTYHPIPLDTRRLDEDIAELDSLLSRGFDLWRGIFETGARMMVEPGIIELNAWVIHHYDEEKYETNTARAAKLQEIANKARGLVTRVGNFFGDRSIQDADRYGALLERHAKVSYLVTLYNTLINWGSFYSLDYDVKLGLFDERDFRILNPKQMLPVPFPRLPRLESRGTTRVATRDTGRDSGNLPVVRDHVTITSDRIRMRRSINPAQVRDEMELAGAMLDVAAHKRAEIRSHTTSEDREYQNGRTRRIYFEDQDDFDKAKPPGADFIVSVTYAKAYRNAAYSLLAGSDLVDADPNLKADWRQLDERFQDLATWGMRSYIQFDRFYRIERNYFLFPYEFSRTNMLDIEEPAPMPQNPGTVGDDAPTSGAFAPHGRWTVSVRSMITVARGMRCDPRRAYVRKTIPMLYDLSDQDIPKIAETMRGCETWTRSAIAQDAAAALVTLSQVRVQP